MKKRLQSFVLAVLFVISMCIVQPIFAADEGIKIKAQADTYIRTGSSVQNNVYGTGTSMVIDPRGSNRMAFVRFKYGSGADESLDYLQLSPHITLNLHVKASTGVGNIEVYGLLGDTFKNGWEETNLTKVTAIDLGLYTTTDNPVATYPLTGVSAKAWVSIDVTDYVKSQSDGVFAFKIDGSGITDAADIIQLYTKEYAEASTPYLSVSSADEGAVDADLLALSLGDITSVTDDFVLPQSGSNGTTITWESNMQSVISISGGTAKVIRPSSLSADDATVKLTATISKGTAQKKKDFMVYVLRAGSINSTYTTTISENMPQDSVPGLYGDNAANAVKQGIVSFDVSDEIYRFASSIDLRMRMRTVADGAGVQVYGLEGAVKNVCAEDMTWNSAQAVVDIEPDSNTFAMAAETWCEIDVTDYINLQEDGTATFRISSASGSFRFYGNEAEYKPQLIIYNYEKESDAELAVSQAKESLTIEGLSSVTRDITLPTKGLGGTKIEWTSSNPAVISQDGRVTRPQDGDVPVILTAVISRNGITASKQFTATVLRNVPDDEAVRLTKEWLALDTYYITQDGSLPEKGLYDVTLSWQLIEETDAIAITDNHYIVKRSDNTELAVQLKATMSSGDARDEKVFNIIVPRNKNKDLLYNRRVQDATKDERKSNDDNAATYWVADSSNPSLTYVLSSEKKISNMILVPYNGADILNCKVEVSRDSYSWEIAYTHQNALSDNTANHFVFDRAYTAKFIRFSFTNRAAGGIRTLSAYAVSADAPTVTAKQIAQGLNFKTVTGYSESSITNDFKLPLTLENGAVLNWKSSDDTVIKVSGENAVVTRSTSTKSVILTATVTYNGESSDINFVLTVEKKPTSGGGSGSGNGGNKRDPIITDFTYSLETEDVTNTPQKESFADLDNAAWAKEYIKALTSKGILSGKGNGNFEPNSPVTREEFVKILVTAFGMKNEESKVIFEDVDTSKWFYNYVAAAVEKGIINGVDEQRFGVGRSILRQDMVVMISRMVEKLNYEITLKADPIHFADEENISDYAADGVKMLSKAGIVTGDGSNHFRPKDTVTRAEVAKIIYMLLKLNQ